MYSTKEVHRQKQLIRHSEAFPEHPSTEYCIAYRSRDILIGRNIVEDLAAMRQTVRAKGRTDLTSGEAMLEYFSAYAAQINERGAFFAIFLKPTEEVREQLLPSSRARNRIESIEMAESPKERYFAAKEAFSEISSHWNDFLWKSHSDWCWFFNLFLLHFSHHAFDKSRGQSIDFFLNTVIEMQVRAESAGYTFDYNYYEDPKSAWLGQQNVLERLRFVPEDFLAYLKTEPRHRIFKERIKSVIGRWW